MSNHSKYIKIFRYFSNTLYDTRPHISQQILLKLIRFSQELLFRLHISDPVCIRTYYSSNLAQAPNHCSTLPFTSSSITELSNKLVALSVKAPGVKLALRRPGHFLLHKVSYFVSAFENDP